MGRVGWLRRYVLVPGGLQGGMERMGYGDVGEQLLSREIAIRPARSRCVVASVGRFRKVTRFDTMYIACAFF
jgi:hypothetical protein